MIGESPNKNFVPTYKLRHSCLRLSKRVNDLFEAKCLQMYVEGSEVFRKSFLSWYVRGRRPGEWKNFEKAEKIDFG